MRESSLELIELGWDGRLWGDWIHVVEVSQWWIGSDTGAVLPLFARTNEFRTVAGTVSTAASCVLHSSSMLLLKSIPGQLWRMTFHNLWILTLTYWIHLTGCIRICNKTQWIISLWCIIIFLLTPLELTHANRQTQIQFAELDYQVSWDMRSLLIV